MAPPEVPLNATKSYLPCPTAKSFLRAPAVKDVWLPPPWHAIATRLILSRALKTPRPLRRFPSVRTIRKVSSQLPAILFWRRDSLVKDREPYERPGEDDREEDGNVVR